MEIPEFVGHALDQVNNETRLSLEGVTLEQLTYRPAPEANSMAWLAWHIARMQDLRASHLTDRGQLWVSDGWHTRFGLPADTGNTGRNHTDEQVAAVRPESPEALSDYCSAAYVRAIAYVHSLAPGDVDHVVPRPEDGVDTTVGAILQSMVHGGLAHVGQIAYVRGLIVRRHWFPR